MVGRTGKFKGSNHFPAAGEVTSQPSTTGEERIAVALELGGPDAGHPAEAVQVTRTCRRQLGERAIVKDHVRGHAVAPSLGRAPLLEACERVGVHRLGRRLGCGSLAGARRLPDRRRGGGRKRQLGARLPHRDPAAFGREGEHEGARAASLDPLALDQAGVCQQSEQVLHLVEGRGRELAVRGHAVQPAIEHLAPPASGQHLRDPFDAEASGQASHA